MTAESKKQLVTLFQKMSKMNEVNKKEAHPNSQLREIHEALCNYANGLFNLIIDSTDTLVALIPPKRKSNKPASIKQKNNNATSELEQEVQVASKKLTTNSITAHKTLKVIKDEQLAMYHRRI